MAAATVVSVHPTNIPGLGKPLDLAQLDMYNALAHIADRTELQTSIPGNISDLLRAIERHSMGDRFRIHSLHRHTILPDSSIRLETDAGETGCKWAHATPFEAVDLRKVHPTFFKLHEGRLIPFEFAEGPLPVDIETIPEAFLLEFAAYVARNELTDMIALELGDSADCRRRQDSATAEIEIQWGQSGVCFTMSVSVKDLVDADGKERRLVPTGWNVPVLRGGPRDSSPDNPRLEPIGMRQRNLTGAKPTRFMSTAARTLTPTFWSRSWWAWESSMVEFPVFLFMAHLVSSA